MSALWTPADWRQLTPRRNTLLIPSWVLRQMHARMLADQADCRVRELRESAGVSAIRVGDTITVRVPRRYR